MIIPWPNNLLIPYYNPLRHKFLALPIFNQSKNHPFSLKSTFKMRNNRKYKVHRLIWYRNKQKIQKVYKLESRIVIIPENQEEEKFIRQQHNKKWVGIGGKTCYNLLKLLMSSFGPNLEDLAKLTSSLFMQNFKSLEQQSLPKKALSNSIRFRI